MLVGQVAPRTRFVKLDRSIGDLGMQPQAATGKITPDFQTAQTDHARWQATGFVLTDELQIKCIKVSLSIIDVW